MHPATIFGGVCVAAGLLALKIAGRGGPGWDGAAALAVSLTGALPAVVFGGLLPRLERLPLGTLGTPDPDDPALTAARSRYLGRIKPLFVGYAVYAGVVSLVASVSAVALAFGILPRWNDWPALAVGWAVASFGVIGVPSGAIGVLGGRWQAEERRRAGLRPA